MYRFRSTQLQRIAVPVRIPAQSFSSNAIQHPAPILAYLRAK
jgi:hypothetical protein